MPDENPCIPVITPPTLSVVGQLRLGWRLREWEESRRGAGGFWSFLLLCVSLSERNKKNVFVIAA